MIIRYTIIEEMFAEYFCNITCIVCHGQFGIKQKRFVACKNKTFAITIEAKDFGLEKKNVFHCFERKLARNIKNYMTR